jgi:hypothetical protein
MTQEQSLKQQSKKQLLIQEQREERLQGWKRQAQNRKNNPQKHG